jgi:tetratricopeptide (TPR) repeat protein
VDPEFVPALWWLADTLTETGGHEESLALYEQALRQSDRMSRILGYYGYACGRAGRHEQARELLAELQERARQVYVPAYFPALVYVGLGEASAALDELERSFAERDTMLRDLRVDPPWAALRHESRFHELLRRMAYPTDLEKLPAGKPPLGLRFRLP